MLKKFLIGTLVAVALLAGVSVSAATDFGPSTLKVGSKGEYVKAVQTLVGVKADGVFGPMTAAKVKVWQAANGLTADGLFGKASMAKANGAIVITPNTPATGSIVVSGDAGDLTVTSSSKGIEDTIKEGDEEKVLALKVEAEDSDIQITNAKIELSNKSIYGSEKLADYVDQVKVYLGSKEVASLDASDFSRDSGTPDVFTKSISLKNAVVKDGDTDYLYVAVVATDDVDSDDKDAVWTLTADSIRFVDGTGAIMTDSTNKTETFGFKLASEDDSLKIKSSSSNPDGATVKVDEDDTTDDVLALAFKLEVDDDSSDMDLQSIKVKATIVNASTSDIDSADNAEEIIDSVVLKIAGEEFDAEDLDDGDVDNGVVSYTFDIDGDVTIDAGDVEDAKVYVTFYKQGTSGANYVNGTTVEFEVVSTGIKAEVDGDSVSSGDITGSQTGALLSLNSVAATVDNMKWVVSSTGTIIDFLFTVKAEDEDFDVLSSSIYSTVEKSSGATVSSGVLSKSTGDAEEVTAGTKYTVSEGDTATFRVRYTITGDNGNWAEVSMTSVAGQTVSDDKEVSPTASINK